MSVRPASSLVLLAIGAAAATHVRAQAPAPFELHVSVRFDQAELDEARIARLRAAGFQVDLLSTSVPWSGEVAGPAADPAQLALLKKRLGRGFSWSAFDPAALAQNDMTFPKVVPPELAAWCDRLSARDAQGSDALVRWVRALEPVAAIGSLALQSPRPGDGVDLERIVPELDFFAASSVGAARELVRGLARAGVRELGAIRIEAAADVGVDLDDHVSHGARGVWLGPVEDVDDGGRLTEFAKAIVAARDALGSARDAFAGATIQHDPIWIVESRESSWVQGVLDREADGSTSRRTRESWVRLVQDIGFQPCLVPLSQLSDRIGNRPPNLLILPAVLVMSEEEAEGIRTFVRAGGCVLADYGVGAYDERFRLRDVPALDDLFGITRHEDGERLVHSGRGSDSHRLDTGVAVAETGVSADIGEPTAAGAMVHCEHEVGDGCAVFWNLAACEYVDLRTDPSRVTAASDLRARLSRVLLGDANTRPVISVHGSGLPRCLETVRLESRAGEHLLAVRLNAIGAPDLLRVLAERGPKPVRLMFPTEVQLRDLRTGEDLGRGREFERTLAPNVAM
ncbi:MAG: hypothetical protein KDB80_14815, partial [Planctomycetes bacterium]|nr:hypothetical protein [Planctomycetota bacterium]